jgi:hypothetical protein
MTEMEMLLITAPEALSYELKNTAIRVLQEEVERLKADPLPAAAWVREVERAAYRRGAESMRAAALAVAHKRAVLPVENDTDAAWCRAATLIEEEVRTLPIPEDKP